MGCRQKTHVLLPFDFPPGENLKIELLVRVQLSPLCLGQALFTPIALFIVRLVRSPITFRFILFGQ